MRDALELIAGFLTGYIMFSKLSNFYELRAKGLDFRTALRTSNIDWKGGLTFALLLILLLVGVKLIEHWAEDKADERAAQHRAQAAENLAAFNMAMQGRPFLIEGNKALLTCKALETKL